jgi:VIT1/CCC1 family predicted Fe2+/Mn2+ transporter
MTQGGVVDRIEKMLIVSQVNEITEHKIYQRLAQSMKDPENRKVLESIAADELRHADFCKQYTKKDIKPNRFKVLFYILIARLFGVTFSVKLMERGEENAQVSYDQIAQAIPEFTKIIEDEEEHEKELIALIDEERLKYVGSMVLGLNDALVELTGVLAGLTLALQNTKLIALTGLITGIAASLSMAASEYLSTKTEGEKRDPVKASIYTGFSYVLTVIFLIFPYFLFTNYLFCLGFALFNALIVVFIFTYYISVVREISFKHRFLEMAGISLGIAFISFLIGYVIRALLNVDV